MWLIGVKPAGVERIPARTFAALCDAFGSASVYAEYLAARRDVG
jgi:hypothetical protein